MNTQTPSPEAKAALDAIEQRAMQVISQHLEPHDCRWDLYAEAARDVVDAIREDIEIRAIRKWADALEMDLAQRSLDHEELTPAMLRHDADLLQVDLDARRQEANRG